MNRKIQILIDAVDLIANNCGDSSEMQYRAKEALERIESLPEEICGNCESWVQYDDKPVGDCTNTTGECPSISNPGFGCTHWESK